MNQEYLKQITSITTRNYVTLNEDNTITDAVKTMRNGDVSSVIITDKTT
jgi:predicted transcriptional regulator